MGVAMMGTGIAEGENRAVEAARKAVSSPLLEDSSVNGARGVIINITGGPDLTLMEVNEASSIIQEAAHEDANIIFGAVVDESLTGRTKITVIATGFESQGIARRGAVQTPTDLAHYAVSAVRAEPVAAAGGGGATPVVINRRPLIDLAGSARTAEPAAASNGNGDGGGSEAPTGFDIPAFMRRPN
jgi:cell division protein FtsZ